MSKPPDLVFAGPVETSTIFTVFLPEGWHDGLGYFPEIGCWTSATNQEGGWVFRDGEWRPTERIE